MPPRTVGRDGCHTTLVARLSKPHLEGADEGVAGRIADGPQYVTDGLFMRVGKDLKDALFTVLLSGRACNGEEAFSAGLAHRRSRNRGNVTSRQRRFPAGPAKARQVALPCTCCSVMITSSILNAVLTLVILATPRR
ncbi:hypothetical protein BV898_18012 [Hypsibius exemplaris]|uniref:Uncharacterized protein n=1 Tax=Hypsibius exemplaris TaxID=2072580 RepID=A0A9X6NN94_HYPEX|nr:hypothetical protein BV898_18012 [Hypsibius exemplaris]